nr:hypothetical protein [Tanacetum cinerariifolium]
MGGDRALITVWLSKEVGTGDEFAQDMVEHCYLLKNEMEEKDRLIAKLEKLAVGSGAAKYDAQSKSFWSTYVYVKYVKGVLVSIWLGDSTPSLPDSLGPLVPVVVFLPTDASSRTCVAGDFLVSEAGSASNGSVTGCKTASKSGTNVCASGLKHVTVAVAVPSLIIALKQYLFVDVMTLCSGKLALEIGTMLVYLSKVRVMSFGSVRSHAFVDVHRKREILSVGLMSAMLMDFASTNGNFPLSVGMIFGSLASVIKLKTFFDIRVPVMMRASMTLLRSCVTISRVPLQRPPDILRFRRSIIGAPTFSSSLCGGKPAKLNEFRYSAGYNSSVSPPSFPCGTASSKLRPASVASESGIHNSSEPSSKFSGIWKHEWAVLPDGNNNVAIPEAAWTKSEQNRTKSRANGKCGKVRNQARQSQSLVKTKKALNGRKYKL